MIGVARHRRGGIQPMGRGPEIRGVAKTRTPPVI